MHDWNAEQYGKFLAERTQPAIDLAARIPLCDPKEILDIGCGPGNSTAVLAKRFPNARITGADNSTNMIEAAKANHPELDFILLDAAKELPALKGEYDVVFSNACIQWIPQHDRLLAEMMSVLRPGGVLAVQIPLQMILPVHRIIRQLTESEKWRARFPNPRIFYNLTPEEYFDLLSALADDFTIWETTYYHKMPSHRSILEWYRGTGLKPYLAVLSSAETEAFEADFLREVERAYPIQPNGEIIFRFPRLFFTAVKSV